MLANFDEKEHLRHRAVSLRQHGFLVIITSSLNSLLPTRAQCGCMDNPFVLKKRSTGAEVAGIQKIFSKSSSKSANSFFYLTRSQSSLSSSSRFRRIEIVIIILCLQNAESSKISRNWVWGRALVSWSSITRTFLKDNNTVSRDLAIVHVTYCIAWHMT